MPKARSRFQESSPRSGAKEGPARRHPFDALQFWIKARTEVRRSIVACLSNQFPCWLFGCFAPLVRAADEEKGRNEDGSLRRITLSVPFAVTPGATNRIVIRGLSLPNATEVRFLSSENVTVRRSNRAARRTSADKADHQKNSGATTNSKRCCFAACDIFGTGRFALLHFRTPDRPRRSRIGCVVA
jgi:hypothetical protein